LGGREAGQVGEPDGRVDARSWSWRPRKGTLIWTKQGRCARVPSLLDGEIVRVWHVLGTDNKTVARRKLARIIAQQAQGDAVAPSNRRNFFRFSEREKRFELSTSTLA